MAFNLQTFPLISSLSILTTLLTGCYDNSSTNNASTMDSPSIMSDEVFISSGTSFGLCVGYCKTTVIISDINVKAVAINNDENNSQLSYESEISEIERDHILSNIDSIFSLPDTVGCPDCADGGSEWIEYTRGSTSKRVTFECGQTINEINTLLETIRPIRSDVFAKIGIDPLCDPS